MAPPAFDMVRDPTKAYFAGSDRDRAAFEAGIKLGSILHQYVGAPLTRATAKDLERAIESATRVQPLVEDIRVRIDRKRLHARGPYNYASVSEEMLQAEVTVRVGSARVTAMLRYVPELDYPLMYLKDVRGPTKP
ncbi:MAG TPA: dihydroneopterin aldolase family protein [Thermoplasmata archaeon]|nr:dihydroneopterin aldolase family protein [Thermoplasmata archaeon]